MAESALRKFVAPEFIIGPGCRDLVGRYARNLGARKVLVVTDPGVVAAGWTGEVTESLARAKLPFAVFSAVSPNPRADEVMAGAEAFRAEECNALVAVGGGSPMDLAKGVGLVVSHGRHILEFEGVDQVNSPIPPLICVPTTGGTSADVSQFAIITDRRERTKIAIVSKAVVPDLSLIDPVTLTTVDRFLGACTGLDALTHGIEAFVSNVSSPITDLHAQEGIGLIYRNLIPSLENPDDLELRSKVMLGSLYTGLAFSNAILGATHAMAHSLGGYLDLPHGACNAILLDHVVEFNYPAAPDRFDRIAAMMDIDLRGMTTKARAAALAARIRQLKKVAGLEIGLSPLGVQPGDIPPLSRKALHDPCLVTNPRPAQQRDLEVLYGEAL